MLRSSLLLSFVLFLTLPHPQSSAQTAASPANPTPATPVASVMPKDPTEFMQLAVRVNGLSSPDTKPWHVKATYQTFDDAGKPKDQGTFEEWWAGRGKYKVSFVSARFNQVEYWDGSDIRMVGEDKWPTGTESAVWGYLLHPLPYPSGFAKTKFAKDETKIGDVHLECLRYLLMNEPMHMLAPAPYPAFCFDKALPALRLEGFEHFLIFFNGIVQLNSQYLAKQIRVTKDGHPQLNVDVTVIDFPATVEAAELIAPADAIPAPSRKRTLSEAVIAADKIEGAVPEYPAVAVADNIQGVVVLGVTITKEGTTSNLHVLSGPPLLQQAAIYAVRTWRYKPFLLNGEPVEVDTKIFVNFQLPSRR